MKKKDLIFLYKKISKIDCLLSTESMFLRQIKKELNKKIEQFKNYQIPYSFLQLPFDKDMQREIHNLVAEKQKLQPTLIVVIGIGGSSMGTKALWDAVSSKLDQPLIQILFLETVDNDYTKNILDQIIQRLIRSEAVVVNVVTKSGTTLETIINFEKVLAILKKYRPDEYQKLLVVTTCVDSPLAVRALKEGYALLSIPEQVGGRFSVFSAVGLFPLALAGIDTQTLCTGARVVIEQFLANDQRNDPFMSAFIQWKQYQEGIRISNLFLFSVGLESLGKWYRQLMAESLGKEIDRDGKVVNISLFPTVSIGSADLHSMVQLYLGGGHQNLFTTFVVVDSTHRSDLMTDFAHATQKAYEKKGIPFCTILLPEKSEYALGQFLQFKMLEIIVLGELFNLNTFDQPQVELYKQELRKNDNN